MIDRLCAPRVAVCVRDVQVMDSRAADGRNLNESIVTRSLLLPIHASCLSNEFNCSMYFRQTHIQFRPAALPTIAALIALALTLYLATWQQGRASEKRLLQATFDQRAADRPVTLTGETRDANQLRYRQARATGRWDAGRQIFIDNKIDANGRVGYHVMTPLKLLDGVRETGTHVLVNRGWVARGPAYPRPPEVLAPDEAVVVTGMVVLPNARFLELAQHSESSNVWQNLTIERYAKAMKIDVLPFVLLAAADSVSQLAPVTERPDARVEKHVEYMLTWYSLAATIVALWVGLNLRFVRPHGTINP
jgi:surfeit locus 1 family protein